MRVGIGSDIHRLVSGRKLIIGGIEIPFDRGEEAHSDGDVLIHALIDAILGAAAAGDIGTLFPDTSRGTENASSVEMLRTVIARTGVRIINIDSTVCLERPKLSPYIGEMRKTLAEAAGLGIERVSVKAKSAEGLGEIGKGLAVSAEAAVLIE